MKKSVFQLLQNYSDSQESSEENEQKDSQPKESPKKPVKKKKRMRSQLEPDRFSKFETVGRDLEPESSKRQKTEDSKGKSCKTKIDLIQSND